MSRNTLCGQRIKKQLNLKWRVRLGANLSFNSRPSTKGDIFNLFE